MAQLPSVTQSSFENRKAVVISNDKLQLTVTLLGGSFATILLRDDPAGVNPLWEPARMARELGGGAEFRGATGHFVCVDGFGPVSPEEREAGLPGHGEAHGQQYEVRQSTKDDHGATLTIEALLPIVQEKFTRTVRIVNGENVLYVSSQLENLMGFDRPVNWAEHATVGSPFLESGATVIDVSGTQSMTRPYDEVKAGASERRLESGKAFTWPMAPSLDGSSIDLRQTPTQPHYLDHATTLVKTGEKYAWVTALNTHKNLIIGYVFRPDEYPWVQYWGNYPPTGKMSRGLEFSTQPFDVSRREVLSSPPLFGAPMYRWLPAKSKITSNFLMFYAQAPKGMTKVDEVRIEHGSIVLMDRAAGKMLTLAASQPFL
jgi:hypothetical protein